MINLLPPQQIKTAAHEQKYRLFLILGVLAVLFLVAAFLALFAVKIQISAKFQSEKPLISDQISDYEKEISSINKDLRNLNSFYAKNASFTEAMQNIYQLMPQEIKLTSLFLNFSEKDGSFSLVMQGLSPTRETLFQLKKNLESATDFKDINFPPSNWIKPEDIEFNVSFKIKI